MTSIRLQETAASREAMLRAQKVPERIGPYRIQRVLGHEPAVTSYLAIATLSGREQRVVLKCMSAPSSQDVRASSAFRDRMRLAKSLSHPSLPAVCASGTVESRLFIAFAHVPGVTLKRLVTHLEARGERIDPRVLVRVAVDLLDALAYAHALTDEKGRSLDIVHRDVSPENISIALDGRAMLEESSLVRARMSSVTTETGIVKGRFAYLAPEQVAGEAVDARADVWSLGVVLWEALAGRALFGGPTGFSSLMSSMLAPIPRLVDEAKVSPELSAVIEHALCRAVDARLPSATAMREALERAVPDMASREDVSAYLVARFPEEVVEDTARILPSVTDPARPVFPLAKRRPTVRWLIPLLLALTLAVGFLLFEAVSHP